MREYDPTGNKRSSFLPFSHFNKSGLRTNKRGKIADGEAQILLADLHEVHDRIFNSRLSNPVGQLQIVVIARLRKSRFAWSIDTRGTGLALRLVIINNKIYQNGPHFR